MATGSGIPQSTGIQTADITPSYSVPHDTAIASALGGLGDQAQQAINGLLEKHYAQVGAADGAAVAAGTKKYQDLPVITDVGRARAAAFQSSYMSSIKTDIDNHIDQTKLAHPMDPAGFQDEASTIVAGYVKGAAPQFATAVQDYAKAKSGLAFNSLSTQKVERDQQTAVTGMASRQQTLSDSMLARAASGQDQSVEQLMDAHEWQMNNQEKVQNPIYSFAPESAAAAEDKVTEQQSGAVLTYHATLVQNAAGGEQGKADALAFIQKEALEPGGSLEGMAPAMRMKLYATAKANIIDLDKADAERRAIEAQEKRDRQGEQRDLSGHMYDGLINGSVTKADVLAAEARGDLLPGDGGRLIKSAESRDKAAAAMGRAASATERSANYGALSVLADGNALTPSALANARASGTVSDIQYLAIKSKMNKGTKPTVDDISKLAADNFKFLGVPKPQADEYEMQIRADANTWAQNNLNPTPGQKQAFAGDWLKKNAHLTMAGTTAGGKGPKMTKAQFQTQRRAAMNGQPISQSDLDRSYATYSAAHP